MFLVKSELFVEDERAQITAWIDDEARREVGLPLLSKHGLSARTGDIKKAEQQQQLGLG